MNKKILVAFTAFLIVAMMTTPLALGAPGGSKVNEKFLSFELLKVSGDPAGPPVMILHPEPPKEAEMMRMILQERMSEAEITINGDLTYLLNEDFTYEAILTIDFHYNHDPLFCTITVDQTLEFLPESGIEGSLEILAKGRYWPAGKDGMGIPEAWTVNIGHGTEDLKGVRIVAESYFIPAGIYYEGTVTNWPMP